MGLSRSNVGTFLADRRKIERKSVRKSPVCVESSPILSQICDPQAEISGQVVSSDNWASGRQSHPSSQLVVVVTSSCYFCI